MLKFDDNPPIISPSFDSLKQIPGQWFVAHTKSRAEKAFAWDLLRMGVGYFLPLMEQVKVSGGRKRRVLLPLFPSYVFFTGDDAGEIRYKAMATDHLCQTIPVCDQGQFVRQLSAVEKALGNKAQLELYPFAAVGKRCRVTAGPFEGVEGVVVETARKARLVLEVKALGQGTVMEIDAGLLEAAE